MITWPALNQSQWSNFSGRWFSHSNLTEWIIAWVITSWGWRGRCRVWESGDALLSEGVALSSITYHRRVTWTWKRMKKPWCTSFVRLKTRKVQSSFCRLLRYWVLFTVVVLSLASVKLDISYLTLPSGIPWNIQQVTCSFRVYTLYCILYHAIENMVSNIISAAYTTRVGCNSVEQTTDFLCSDWLYFPSRGVKFMVACIWTARPDFAPAVKKMANTDNLRPVHKPVYNSYRDWSFLYINHTLWLIYSNT